MNKQQIVLLQGLAALYENKLLTDVILSAEGKEFPCHRSVLAASSEYFRVMFTSDVREQASSHIEIREVAAQDLKLVLDFIYKATVDINVANAQSVFITANMLQVLPLVDLVANFMKTQLCPNNSVEIYNFASDYSCDQLKTASKHFLLENFRDVVKSEGFLALELAELESVLSEDLLGVECEEEVYRALITWIEFNKEKRQDCVFNLIKHLRVTLLQPTFLTVMQENSIFSENKKILHHLKKLQTQSSENCVKIEGMSSIFSTSCAPRLGMLKRSMIVFAGGANSPDERSLTCFDPTTNKNYYGIKQHSSFDFKHKIDYHRVVTTEDNRLFFLGGVLYEDYHFEPTAAALESVFMYNERDVKWVRKANMLTPRCGFSAATSGGRIFVTGGKTTYPRGGPLFMAECYMIEEDQWLPLSHMPIGLYHHASTVHEDSLYVFGGIEEDEQHVDTVFQYKISTDSWTLVETVMTNPRAEFSAITYKGRIYLIGGANRVENVTAVEIFNPKSRRWQIGSDFPEDRNNMAAVLMGDSIYVCGGVKNIGSRGNRRGRMVASRDLYKYDLTTTDWSREVKLVQYANIHTCTTCILNTKFLHESDFISTN